MKKIILITLTTLFLIFFHQILAGLKGFLLISQEFPQIPIKPLHFLTNKPGHEFVRFSDGVVADLFLPNYSTKRPALIVAMGVRTNEKDKPTLLGFADTLARLGFVVLWPRLEALDQEKVKFEQPQTFIDSFKYLEKRIEVKKDQVSFVGFSVGSSIAMVAAQDLSINNEVHSLVFFGGYYNILDYLTSLATKSFIVDGQKVSWSPDQSGIDHANGILEKEGLVLSQFAQGELTKQDEERLLKYSPDQNLPDFKTPIFILHEKADNFVPFVESIKLRQALKGKLPITFHLANLFEHVQPKRGLSPQLVLEFAYLFGFLHKVLMFL